LAPKYLGQKFTIARSYVRIGWQNLINFGIIPFEFKNTDDWDALKQGDVLRIENIRETIKNNDSITATLVGKGKEIQLAFNISDRQVETILKGGIVNYMKQR